MKIIVYIIWFFAAVQAVAEGLYIQVGEQEYTLCDELYGNYFGVYASPMDLTFGSDLHLFPNGEFIITNWIDIGGAEVVAAGKYNVKGHRLNLFFKNRIKGEFPIEDNYGSKLYLYSGSVVDGNVSMGNKVFLLNQEQLQEAKTKENFLNYRYLKREYLPWAEILDNLKKEMIEPVAGGDATR